MLRSGRLAVGIALVALWVVAAWSEQNRVLQGRVLDQDGHAMQGAVVQIENRSTYWIRSYVTQAEGRYHFEELDGDVTYEVHATFKGVSSRTKGLSKFSAHAVTTIDLVIDHTSASIRSAKVSARWDSRTSSMHPIAWSPSNPAMPCPSTQGLQHRPCAHWVSANRRV